MKKVLALSIICSLLLTVCTVPASEEPQSQPQSDLDPYTQYLREVADLEEGIHTVLQDLTTQKNSQVVYEHLLQLTYQAATLRGTVYRASRNLEDIMHISLQSSLEILLHPELSQPHRLEWQERGYTEEEITSILHWVLYYNDSYYHSARGISPGQRVWFASLGLTESEIEELQQHITSNYSDLRTTQDMVALHQEELLNIQVSLSVATLKTVLEIEKGQKRSEKDTRNKRGHEQIDRLLRVEKDLAELIETELYEPEHPITHSALERIKAYSHQMIKAAEQVIRSGFSEYSTDFFLALQIHCAALTALSGHEGGIQELLTYQTAVQECAASEERPSLSRDSSVSVVYSAQQPVPLGNPVGNVEEWFEENNFAVAHVLAKLPETSWMEYILMISTFSYGIGSSGSITLPSLSDALAGLFVGGAVSSTSICIGVSGGTFLLIMTAEPVGYAWPPYVPGQIRGNRIIIIVDGSYGQGHIEARAQSSDPCIKSSHQAILDNKYMISKITYSPNRIFHHLEADEYLFYFIDEMKREWAVFVREYQTAGIYELRTAFRVDCPPPHICMDKEGRIYEYNTIIEKWICQGFIEILNWCHYFLGNSIFLPIKGI